VIRDAHELSADLLRSFFDRRGAETQSDSRCSLLTAMALRGGEIRDAHELSADLLRSFFDRRGAETQSDSSCSLIKRRDAERFAALIF
jgi:hypothetical protein